jgi:hypothetical protein
MNSGKKGKLFAVLMVSLVAFGFGSCVNVLNSGNDITSGILPSSFALNGEDQLTIIEDSSFEPVHVKRHYYNMTNTTNSTNTSNKVSNSTTNKNNTKEEHITNSQNWD